MAIPPVISSPVAILSCGFRQIKGIAAAERAIPRPKAQKNNEFFAAG
jgi:hypothetical protein